MLIAPNGQTSEHLLQLMHFAAVMWGIWREGFLWA